MLRWGPGPVLYPWLSKILVKGKRGYATTSLDRDRSQTLKGDVPMLCHDDRMKMIMICNKCHEYPQVRLQYITIDPDNCLTLNRRKANTSTNEPKLGLAHVCITIHQWVWHPFVLSHIENWKDLVITSKPFEVIQQLRFCMLLRDSMMFKEMAFQTPYGI